MMKIIKNTVPVNHDYCNPITALYPIWTKIQESQDVQIRSANAAFGWLFVA